MKIGYFLSSEQFGPRELLDQARRAADAGFEALWISDHFHPWNEAQGQSPFVWSVIGALAEAVPELPVSTSVTCPIIRIHPVIVAQAAATSAVMHEGRFALGVGSGENLNEHVCGAPWPPVEERLDMLRESIEVMRLLWTGEVVDFRGDFYKVSNARIYTLPSRPPPVLVSGFGAKATRLAADVGDGFVTMNPDLVEVFRGAGGRGPVQSGIKTCYDRDEGEAVATAHRFWANDLLPSQLNQELAVPALIEEAASLVGPEMMGEAFACGPDPERHLRAVQPYAEAGFDEVYVQQIGPDLDGFFDLWANKVLPELRHSRAA